MIGLGGIIGGGILLLAGPAFASAGPAAILAFALNGVVAWGTAMSLCEISTMFPESGGAYTFAKKVLSVRAAFAVGWVLWFAYIVAAVLYALGFASFTAILLRGVCAAAGLTPPAWLAGRDFLLLLATIATVGYSIGLVRESGGGGQWATIGKIGLFLLVIAAGLFALVRQPLAHTGEVLVPFFSGGLDGLIAAMGVTFISLQGFEMISAVAGEIREPRRTIPRAVFLSLAISLAIYIPMMFLVATAGVAPGDTIVHLANANPDTVVAVAARNFLGAAGYWFVVVAIILATLSALQANLMTASRVAFAMASDRTLPAVLARRHPTRGTPLMAIYATTLATVAILFMVSDLTSAGAAASLIFLLAFALTHVTAYLARKRGGNDATGETYRSPMFPLVPIAGGVACTGLAVFQAVVVPNAGGVLVIWLGLGVLLYFALFKDRAEAADATAAALDPRLHKLRGKTPLVLLPIANPSTARSMVEVANALAPTEFARVLLLAIVRSPRGKAGDPLARLADAQDAVRQALTASYLGGHAPEALITAASEPWAEIRRVADEHQCESLLLGIPANADPRFDELLAEVDCDVAMMRAPDEWEIGRAARVLVPLRDRPEDDDLRARLLGTLCRVSPREIVFLTVAPEHASDEDVAAARRVAMRYADLHIPMTPVFRVVRSADPAEAILDEATRCDLLVLAAGRSLGEHVRRIARESPCAVMLLARRTDRTK
jgi:amino acid transporter/nucleotide-binding universal stress UspA family protein